MYIREMTSLYLLLYQQSLTYHNLKIIIILENNWGACMFHFKVLPASISTRPRGLDQNVT